MLQWIIPLAILIAFEGVADILAKNWSSRGGAWLGIGALAAYLLANTFWLFALKNGSGLGRGAIIFSVVSAIVALTLGFFMYHEKIQPHQAIGVVLGVASLFFIFWE